MQKKENRDNDFKRFIQLEPTKKQKSLLLIKSVIKKFCLVCACDVDSIKYPPGITKII